MKPRMQRLYVRNIVVNCTLHRPFEPRASCGEMLPRLRHDSPRIVPQHRSCHLHHIALAVPQPAAHCRFHAQAYLVQALLLPMQHGDNARLSTRRGHPRHALPCVQQLKASGAIKPLWLVEKEAIEEAIALCNGNIPRAAALLEVNPSTIYRRKAEWEKERLLSAG